MSFELPALPYAKAALEPHISAQTLNFHYDKHHAGYVKKLNSAIEGTKFASCKGIEEIITTADGKIYNFAAQAWNHEFYWHCLTPEPQGRPGDALGKAITSQFGSIDDFIAEFREAALEEFGSGWAWLTLDDRGSLAIDSTTDAVNPLSGGLRPLLTLDVWEHAYYLDYQNERAAYVDAFLKSLINWEFAAENFRKYS